MDSLLKLGEGKSIDFLSAKKYYKDRRFSSGMDKW